MTRSATISDDRRGQSRPAHVPFCKHVPHACGGRVCGVIAFCPSERSRSRLVTAGGTGGGRQGWRGLGAESVRTGGISDAWLSSMTRITRRLGSAPVTAGCACHLGRSVMTGSVVTAEISDDPVSDDWRNQ
jgi:hypothetical protein